MSSRRAPSQGQRQGFPRALDELLHDPDPERAGRAVEAMLGMSKIEVEGLRRAAGAAPAA
jgi:hypothetical protein